MKNKCSRSINHIGTTIKFEKSDQIHTLVGSAQPKFSSKNETDNLGYGMSSDYIVYLCSDDSTQLLKVGDFIYTQGRELKLTRIEPIHFADEVLYYKATAQLCREGVNID